MATWTIPVLFLLLTLPVMLALARSVPAGESPDEPMHILRADSLLQGEIIGRRLPEKNIGTGGPDAGLLINPGIAMVSFYFSPVTPRAEKKVSAARGALLASLPWWPKPVWFSAPNTAAYAPPAYVPAAIGIALAKLGGAGPSAAIVWARIATIAAYTGLGLLALLLARRGRLLLLAVLGLPMSLGLAAAVTQDGLILALAVLAAACLSRQSRGGCWGAAATLAVLLLQKPPYLPLALLPLVACVPGIRLAERLAASALVALPAILWSAIVTRLVTVPLRPGLAYPAGPLWPGTPGRMFRSNDAAMQLVVLLHHPVAAILMPLRGLIADRNRLGQQLIGVLGYLEIALPFFLYVLWIAALAIALLAVLREAAPLPSLPGARWRQAGGVLLALCGCVWLIYLTEYLTWTEVGAAAIDGVQGRYFLPLLPFLALAVPISWPSRVRGEALAWMVVPLAALVCGIVVMPPLVRHYFGLP